jgi:hypothetical protein
MAKFSLSCFHHLMEEVIEIKMYVRGSSLIRRAVALFSELFISSVDISILFTVLAKIFINSGHFDSAADKINKRAGSLFYRINANNLFFYIFQVRRRISDVLQKSEAIVVLY